MVEQDKWRPWEDMLALEADTVDLLRIRVKELEHERDQLRDRVADLQFDLRALTDHEAFKNAEDVIERDS
jgi:FtsZ-binding cell division protein ZapB